MNKRDLYRRLLTYVRGFWWVFVLALLGNLLYSGVDAGMTYLLKPLLNQGFIEKDNQFLHWLPGIIIGMFLLRGLSNFTSSYCMTYVGRHVIMRMREEIFQKLQILPARFFDHTRSGQLLAIIVYNADQVACACTEALTTMVQSGALVLGLFGVMLANSWRLTCLYFIAMPLILLIVRFNSRYMRRISQMIQKSVANMTHIAQESIDGYKVVRIFGGQAYETKKFQEAISENRHLEMKLVTNRSLTTSSVQMIAGSILAIAICLATLQGSVHMLSAGAFVSFIAAMLAMLKPMRDLTTVNSKIQQGLAAAQSVFDVLDEPYENDKGTQVANKVSGAIEFNSVSFSYAPTSKQVLKGVSFRVEPGQTVALVGRSGSGKTTMMNLLARFYEGYDGCITLDGVDIEKFTLSSYRKQFAIVSQHVSLFNDTIRRNIAYGENANALETLFLEASRASYTSEFVQTFPDSFDTEIGGNGVLLSGGQRQRLAIARALLKDAPILILDEATSSLDTESERYIQNALQHLMKNRTTLVIAHRLSTIETADLILVMNENGQLEEQGTHKELLAQKGHYAKLYAMQFRDEHV